MSDMVERAVRAMCDVMGEPPCDYPACGCGADALLVRQALAAIAAMREPSEGMVAAMNDEITNGVRTEGYSDENQYGVYEPDDEAAPWRAMIDAALNPPSESK